MNPVSKFINRFRNEKNVGSPITKSVKSIGIFVPDELLANAKNFFTGGLKEQKGQISKDKLKNYSQKGVAHPFDFKVTIELYKKFGLVTGVVDKYVDFIVGEGFRVTSTDSRAEAIINQFIQDTNFDNALRQWLRDALITGNGFMELVGKPKKPPTSLVTHNPVTFFVEVDEFNEALNYWQQLPNEKPIEFSTDEIAHLPINKLSDTCYGLGIVFPAELSIESYIKNSKQKNVLLERKANAPYHVKIGDSKNGIMPTPESVNEFGAKLQFLKNNHEWCTDDTVTITAVDFGNPGDKFDNALEQDLRMMNYTFQVPRVLMGDGNIPEGLAEVQIEAFRKRIKSIQEEIEKVIETNIFNRIISENGLNSRVEIEWGSRSEIDTRKEIDQITELLKNPFISQALRIELENRLADLMNLDVSEIPEIERMKEETEDQQPRIPGQNNPNAVPAQPPKEHVHAKHCACDTMESFIDGLSNFENLSLTVKEWVEFDYNEYLHEIILFVNSKEFNQRQYTGFKYVPGTNQQEWIENEIKYKLTDSLSEGQVDKLKTVLKEGFSDGKTIRDISNDISHQVSPEDLKVKVPDMIDENGKVLRKGYEFTVPGKVRSVMMARSETVRAANEGALKQFRTHGIDEVSWVSSTGERTCTFCLAQHGKVLPINEARNLLPVHSGCRCSFIAKVR